MSSKFSHFWYQFKCANIKWISKGEGDQERYYTEDGVLFFQINPKFYRPAEVHELLGDCSRAEKEIGWKKKTSFSRLVKKMYEKDYSLLNE